MNNLFSLLLAAGEASGEGAQAADTPDLLATLTQYAVYAVIIVVSIMLLVILRRRTRLPRHGEFKKKLVQLSADIGALSGKFTRMKFIRSVSQVMYKADNLAYAANMLAAKEKYADFGDIASLINAARAELAPYKAGRKEAAEAKGLSAAAEKVESAIAVLDGVLARDEKINRK